MNTMCSEAHASGLRAEELLVRLKQVFHQLPEVQELPHGGDRSDLLNRVVSLCIEEYYRAPRPAYRVPSATVRCSLLHHGVGTVRWRGQISLSVSPS